MAKNGWKLSKVAVIGSTRSFLAKRVKMGVGQSDTANSIFCRSCVQVHSFLSRKASGAPVFGHRPFKNGHPSYKRFSAGFPKYINATESSSNCTDFSQGSPKYCSFSEDPPTCN